MQLPVVRGLIDRRILVNYRIDPQVLEKVLPAPFRPKQIGGYGVAGICLIRMRHIRPRFVPAMLGVGSENAAHRIAVEWMADGKVHEGVYIPRRDTSSRMNVLVGGRLFPGVQHHARFTVDERADFLDVAMQSSDGQTQVAVRARPVERLPETSVFESVDRASEFFERGSLGYSATHTPGRFDGLELCTHSWHVQPLAVEHVQSSWFADISRFPAGSAEFDSALLMRNINHEWHGRDSIEGAVEAAC